jgi:hypothetical protein
MLHAICVKCGQVKRRPYARCKSCGLDPRHDDATLVKSIYLSLGRYDDWSEHRSYSRVLETLAQDLKAGRPVTFDEQELARLENQLRVLRSVPSSAPWIALAKLFAPAVLILFALTLIVWLLRSLR